MKQVWLVSYHLDDVTAGPSVRFQRYAPLFLEKGYRLTFVTHWKDRTLPEKESRDFFDILRVRASTKYLHQTLFVLKAIWKALTNSSKPAAVLTFSLNTFQLWILPFVKLKKLRLIYISTMDFTTEYRPGNNLTGKIYNDVHINLYRLLYKNIYAIVGSSPKLLESFKVFRLPETKLVAINNGVNVARFYPVSLAEKEDLRLKLNLPSKGKIILYVGLKTERKGILDLYKAWKIYHQQHPEDYLLLVGSEKSIANSSEFNQQWVQIKQGLAKDSLGIILRENHPQVEAYFQASDVFVFLSYKEGMPNVLLEAMACGLPVITTAFQGFSKDYGEPGHQLLTIERNPAIIASQLAQITTNPNLARQIGDAAVEKIKHDFEVGRSVERYIRLLEWE